MTMSQVDVNLWETCGNWEVDKEKTDALEYTIDGHVSLVTANLGYASPPAENYLYDLSPPAI